MTQADIDETISNIEYKLWTDTLSLKEEKKYLQEIQELKRNRTKVAQCTSLKESYQDFRSGATNKARIQEINAQLSGLRDQKRQWQEELTKLNEGRTEQLGDLPVIIKKRD